MSSYLSIYVQKKGGKPTILTSYSRNTDIYQYFNENLNIAYAGNEEKYTKLDKSDVDIVIREFESDINKAKERLTLYEKYASDNPDYIQDILDTKEYIGDLAYWKDKTSFIADMLNDIDYNHENGIEAVFCNID